MESHIRKLMKQMTFEWQGHQFEFGPDLLTMLHHWNFGTSLQWYRSKDKKVILPDVNGHLVEIRDVGAALDHAFELYNLCSERAKKQQSGVGYDAP